mgnify:CR=1 FL=1
MDRRLELAHRLARYGAWVAGALIIGAAVLIGIDIGMRKLFNESIGGASELSGYVLAISEIGRAHV